jgi:hypothetical protein
MEDNEYTRNIRSLENKLDKAMIKYNEAQSIRKTYEQIVRRLKEERVGFDNQVINIIIIIIIIIYYRQIYALAFIKSLKYIYFFHIVSKLAAIERTLAAKQRDYDELLLLSGDANHARESALGELDRVRAGYEEERRRREKELRERHQVVQIRRQMLERMKQREKLRGQLEGAAEEDMKASMAMSAATQKQIASERIEARNKIGEGGNYIIYSIYNL